MQLGEKHNIKYGFLGNFSIVDEKNAEVLRVKHNILVTRFMFYELNDSKKPVFQLSKVASKMGILKNTNTYSMFDQNDFIIGYLACEIGINALGQVTVLDSANNEIGKFVPILRFYKYIVDDKIVGKLLKNTFLGYTYLLDLSSAESGVDRRIPLCFSVLAISLEMSQQYRRLTYSKKGQTNET
ncbi:MAG: hypothetical protein ABH952_06835 [Candidatus Omnitrophota bacterium]